MTKSQAITKIEALARIDGIGSGTLDDIIRIIQSIEN